MKNMEKNDQLTFEQIVYNKYNDQMPRSIIKLLIDENERYDNLAQMLDMFDSLDKIKNGQKDINHGFDEYNEKLNEKFIYPQHGGKEEFLKKFTHPDNSQDVKKDKKKNKKNGSS